MLIILGIFVVFIILVTKAIKTVFGFMKEATGIIYDELNDPDYFTNNDENWILRKVKDSEVEVIDYLSFAFLF